MKSGAHVLNGFARKGRTFPAFAGFTVWLMGASPLAALAQAGLDIGSASKITVVPRISVTETLTSNVFLSSTAEKAELITQVSPGIRISSNGGRIRGTLDYSLTELLYANNSSARRSQNSLNAFGTAELVDDRAFIDFSGVIGQQSVSAFGTPAGNGTALNGNSTETSVFRLSPYVRGSLGSFADYDARYSITSSSSGASTVSDVDARDASLRLNGVGGRIGSGWSVAADHQSYSYSAGRSTESRRLTGQWNYPFSTRWGAYIKGGYESNDFATATRQTENFSALGLNWTPNDEARFSIDQDSRGFTGLAINWAPSKRTSVAVTRERRLFGDSHSIALGYRTPNTAWTFSDSRNVVAFQGQGLTAVSLYDFLLGQLTAGETDPVKREQSAAFLQANGITPGAIAITGFLSSSLSVQRQQQLSFTLFGARNTVTVVATRSRSNKLDGLTTALDDFSTSTAISQNGFSVNYSYRITPQSVLSVVAANQNSSGSAGQNTSLRTVNVNLSARINKDTTANIGARHVVFDGNANSHTETAVLGNLNVQF